jgi:hypothetical protein
MMLVWVLLVMIMVVVVVDRYHVIAPLGSTGRHGTSYCPRLYRSIAAADADPS